MPLRILSLKDCQSLLAYIALSLFAVTENRLLCVNESVINFEKYKQKGFPVDEVCFTDFKMYVLGLFGKKLLHLSDKDVDNTFRKMHKELIVVETNP
jgi:hypothetical protein